MSPAVALKVAHRRSTHLQHRHAAIVERGGAYVAMEANRGWRHAEVAALRRLRPDQRRGVRIWSLRFSRRGGLLNAKPCAACQEFLRANGVKSVRYSTSSGEIEVLKL